MACEANLMEGNVRHMADTRSGTLVRIYGTETITHGGTPVYRMFLHGGGVG